MTTASGAIRFERLPARRGVQWLRSAYAMLSLARLPWLALIVIYYFLFGLIALVPYVGPYAVEMLKPVFAVGFLAAAWSQERGGSPRPSQLFAGFRSNLRALVALGIVFVVGMNVALQGTALIDDGRLLELLSGKAKLDEGLIDDRVQFAMLFAIACALPVVMSLWFAPALVVFQDCTAGRALATSLAAAVANWRPILLYGLLVFFYGGVLPSLLVAVVQLIMPTAIAPPVALLVVMPYFLLFFATLHISDYVSYRDIFHHDEVHQGVHTAPVNPPPGNPQN